MRDEQGLFPGDSAHDSATVINDTFAAQSCSNEDQIATRETICFRSTFQNTEEHDECRSRPGRHT